MSNILISDSTHTYQSLREKKLEKIIDNDGFGKIHIINMNIFWNRSQEYYDNEKWRGTKKIDGGIFYNQTSHHLDLLINLFGPLVKVSSFLSKNRKNIEVEDTAVVSLLFKSGLVGSINVSMLIHFGNYETSLTLVGDKGTLKIGGKNSEKLSEEALKIIKNQNLAKKIGNNLRNRAINYFAIDKLLKYENQCYDELINL